MHDIPKNPELLQFESDAIVLDINLMRAYGNIIRSHCLKKDPRLDADEFAADVLEGVVNAYPKSEFFRTEISKVGIRNIHKTRYFWGIVRKLYSEHQRNHDKATPKETTESETFWLRLLSCRSDGMVFPLNREAMSLDERRWLEKLASKKMSKVRPVPAGDGSDVWAHGEAKQPMTLTLTPRGEGDGERDLEKLHARQFLESVPCNDAKHLWKMIDGIPHALRLSSLGRSYLQQISAAWIETSTDSADANASQDDLDAYYEMKWYMGRTMRDVLEVVVNRCGMSEIDARIYLLHKVGDPPENGPWVRDRIAKEVGLNRRKVERIEKRWDNLFRSQKYRELMQAYFGSD